MNRGSVQSVKVVLSECFETKPEAHAFANEHIKLGFAVRLVEAYGAFDVAVLEFV